MSRTITFTDAQSAKLLSVVCKEFHAPYASVKERAVADELYRVITTSEWVPSGPDEIPPHCSIKSLFDVCGDLTPAEVE